ncbi:hypothetical protein SAMN04487788_1796 [Microbacterium testaceum StLB037]|jgi:hypothetical protein|uniref:Excreted virulence factor EspC, type VII ESX diderm n=1 Tax=Microbacterium testaceum (strain StLB037) TaxID=979556 RepID=A0A1H0P736_MICTS|nr:hypothetical protein [Microbacterium testaceum]SDP00761.1 hypothetical protein SAMN04487788_1796 [Microbacterium testaceum StLB037]
MGLIEVDSDAYDIVRQALTQAAGSLNSASGQLGSAVPGMAFGPLAAFIPPGFNALGGLIESASSFVGDRAQRTADGLQVAVSEFERVEDAAQVDFQKLGGDI